VFSSLLVVSAHTTGVQSPLKLATSGEVPGTQVAEVAFTSPPVYPSAHTMVAARTLACVFMVPLLILYPVGSVQVAVQTPAKLATSGEVPGTQVAEVASTLPPVYPFAHTMVAARTLACVSMVPLLIVYPVGSVQVV